MAQCPLQGRSTTRKHVARLAEGTRRAACFTHKVRCASWSLQALPLPERGGCKTEAVYLQSHLRGPEVVLVCLVHLQTRGSTRIEPKQVMRRDPPRIQGAHLLILAVDVVDDL